MRKLYEIREDIMQAIDQIINGAGTEEEAAGSHDLENLEIEATEKVRNCFWAINKLNAESAEADVVIKNAQAYKMAREKAIDRIEADIKITMEVMGIEKINEPDCRVTLGASGPRAEITDMALIPMEFVRVIPESREPNKAEILKALKANVVVPGAEIRFGEPRLTYPKIKGE